MSEQAPVVWAEASGACVTDVDGNVFIDFTSGVLVTNIGHSHARQVAAIRKQAARLMNCYDFVSPPRVELAKRLVSLTPPQLDRAFIVTTGSEAVEAAIKTARRFTGKTEILGFHGGFHGRTFGAMSAGALAAVKRGFGPVATGFLHVPFPYCYRCPYGHDTGDRSRCPLHTTSPLDRLMETESTGSVAALITEPYLGGGGAVTPPPGWLQRVHAWCQDRGILFILDEVQSSFGRTGSMFAFEQLGFTPNLLCLGKGLGSGVAVSAVLGESRVMDTLDPGSLSSTNGGNPLACAAALAAIDVLVEGKLADRAARLGAAALDRMRSWLTDRALCGVVGDVRGMGLALGVEIIREQQAMQPAPELARRIVLLAAQRGLLLIAPIGLYGNVVRIAPPLVIEEDALDRGLSILRESIAAALTSEQ